MNRRMVGYLAQTAPTLADIIQQVTSAATDIVPASTVGLVVTAGAVIALASYLIRRFLRAGR